MSFTIVSSRALAQYQRWDAAFFIALRSVKTRFQALQLHLSADDARARLRQLRPEDLTPCLILARGQRPRLSLDAVINEYPHLALALVESTLSQAIARTEATLAEDQRYLLTLRQLLQEASSSSVPTGLPHANPSSD